LEEARNNPFGEEKRLPKTPGIIVDQAYKKLDRLRILMAAASSGQAAVQLDHLKQLALQLGAEALTDEIFRLQMMVRKEEWERCVPQLLTIETELQEVEKQIHQEKSTP